MPSYTQFLAAEKRLFRTCQVAQTKVDTMINDEGENIDLYIPRKW